MDFQHTIHVRQLAATIDVHIHYSLEQQDGETTVSRWLVLDIAMPFVFRPLRPLVTASFDKENLRTMAALKQYAEAQSSVDGPARAADAGDAAHEADTADTAG